MFFTNSNMSTTNQDGGTRRRRITSLDLTPDTLGVGEISTRMTRLGSNVGDLYLFDHGRLGTGSFSEVKQATRASDGAKVAIKVISKALVRQKNRIIQEIRMLLEMSERPHIVQLYDVFETDDKLYLVMEMAKGGNLFERIVKKSRYTETEAKALVRNLLEGVADLHDRGIIHRDLKPENILLKSRESNTDIAISDFGLSKYVKQDVVTQRTVPDCRLRNRAFSCCGTDIYQAPDVLQNKGYSYPADVWSCGVILYGLLAGYPPFWSEEESQIPAIILRGKVVFYKEEWDAISEQAKEAVLAMLCVDPDKRVTAHDALKLAWFNTDTQT